MAELAAIGVGFWFVGALIWLGDYWVYRVRGRNPLLTCSDRDCRCVLPLDEMVHHLSCKHSQEAQRG